MTSSAASIPVGRDAQGLRYDLAFTSYKQMGSIPLFAGAIGITVPGAYWYSFYSVGFAYVTSNAVGVRIPGLSIRDGQNNVVANAFPGNGQDPSQSVQYSAWAGAPSVGAKNDPQTFSMPILLVPSSYSLILSVSGGDAADSLTQSIVYVQQIPTGPALASPLALVPTPISL